MMTDPAVEVALAQTERWFVRRGLPHFIERYSASRDILTRAAPALTLVFLAEVFAASNRNWPWWANTLAVASGFGIALGGWGLVNRWRGRPALARPEDVGAIEIGVFVLLPAILPVVFGGQLRQALLTATGNVALLAAIFGATSYGVLPMTAWAARRLARQIGSLAGLLVRALPLLLVFVTFLFLNAEVWQATSTLTGWFLGFIVGGFAVIGVAFVLVRLPRELGELAAFESWEATRVAAQDSPLAAVADVTDAPPDGAPPLTRRQRGNVGLLVLFGQGLQILTVTAIIGAFLFWFGLLMVAPTTIETWTQTTPHVLAEFSLADRTVFVTEELLKVCGFLTAFTGLYFTVVVLTDAAYRAEFLDDVLDEVREALAVRATYLACRGG
jgi:hypothetical protein